MPLSPLEQTPDGVETSRVPVDAEAEAQGASVWAVAEQVWGAGGFWISLEGGAERLPC